MRNFQKPNFTVDLLRLVVRAGDKFPEAWRFLESYIIPTSSTYFGIPIIANSKVHERFPDETLELLWTVYSRNNTSDFYDLLKIIESLLRANPKLETDRRLQDLQRRTVIS